MDVAEFKKVYPDLLKTDGYSINIQDKAGRYHCATVRIKSVRCGKEGCTKCPHHQYAYAQYRVGSKVTEVYLGVARQS